MSKFSKEVYERIFDNLLSEELSFNSVYASEVNIQNAIKHVLGNAVKSQHIKLYSDLVVHSDLNVSFKIIDPDDDIIPVDLRYGE